MNILIIMGFLVIAISLVTIGYASYFLETRCYPINQKPFVLAIGASLALLVMEGGDSVRGMVSHDNPEFFHIFVMQLVVILMQTVILFFVREHGFKHRCNDCKLPE